MKTKDQVLMEVENFLIAHKMEAATFGRLAANNPQLISRLRKGYGLRSDTIDKITYFINSH